MTISIETDERGLVIRTPYSSMFVSELKRLIPVCDRQFDGQSKAWIVSPQHAPVIQKLIMTVYREAVHIPAPVKTTSKLERVEIRVEYVGQCKQRSDGSISAYGHDGQSWAYILPESVLRAFFGSDVKIDLDGVENRPTVKPATLYATLLLKPDVDSVTIKSAYRRMARLTHPDVNHEPDAAEQFKAVQHAYEVLSNRLMRQRYDAGLALEASLTTEQPRGRFDAGYLSLYFHTPLRCGLLTVDGERKLGRVIVSKIHKWDDIVENGKTLITSWPFGAETFERMWI